MHNRRWTSGVCCAITAAREGGVLEEILVENMHRNKEGNTVIFDSVVLEKVVISRLNTAVFRSKVILGS